MTAITPTAGLVADNDHVVDAWVPSDGMNKITVQVVSGDELERGAEGFHFALYPEQAVALAHRLRELAELANPVTEVRP